jgi:hypothetical protein
MLQNLGIVRWCCKDSHWRFRGADTANQLWLELLVEFHLQATKQDITSVYASLDLRRDIPCTCWFCPTSYITPRLRHASTALSFDNSLQPVCRRQSKKGHCWYSLIQICSLFHGDKTTNSSPCTSNGEPSKLSHRPHRTTGNPATPCQISSILTSVTLLFTYALRLKINKGQASTSPSHDVEMEQLKSEVLCSKVRVVACPSVSGRLPPTPRFASVLSTPRSMQSSLGPAVAFQEGGPSRLVFWCLCLRECCCWLSQGLLSPWRRPASRLRPQVASIRAFCRLPLRAALPGPLCACSAGCLVVAERLVPGPSPCAPPPRVSFGGGGRVVGTPEPRP